jgi:hypothetical protein
VQVGNTASASNRGVAPRSFERDIGEILRPGRGRRTYRPRPGRGSADAAGARGI